MLKILKTGTIILILYRVFQKYKSALNHKYQILYDKISSLSAYTSI